MCATSRHPLLTVPAHWNLRPKRLTPLSCNWMASEPRFDCLLHHTAGPDRQHAIRITCTYVYPCGGRCD